MPHRWIVAALSSGLVVVAADDAAACTPDPCAGTDAFVDLARVGQEDDIQIPTDGVVVMRAQWFGDLEPDALLAGLSLTVLLDGDPVAGAVEWIGRPGLTNVALWRPAEPLAPEATYEALGTFTNLEGVPAECAAARVDVGFTFTTTAGPAEPLPAPVVWSSSSTTESPLYELGSLICCDGAMPVLQNVCDIDQGVTWSEGTCVSATNRTRLDVTLGVASVLDTASSGQWMRTLYQDGEEVTSTLSQNFSRDLREPACFTVEQRSLATGESFLAEERCFGDDVTVPLGDVRINPSDQLHALCNGEPYVCGADDAPWAPERCMPWELLPDPDAAPETGCGCTTTRTPDLAALALLGLLVRRRRARA